MEAQSLLQNTQFRSCKTQNGSQGGGEKIAGAAKASSLALGSFIPEYSQKSAALIACTQGREEPYISFHWTQ